MLCKSQWKNLPDSSKYLLFRLHFPVSSIFNFITYSYLNDLTNSKLQEDKTVLRKFNAFVNNLLLHALKKRGEQGILWREFLKETLSQGNDFNHSRDLVVFHSTL